MKEKIEIEKIMKYYQDKPQNLSKLEELRALDSKVKKPARIFSYIYGSLGALIFGTGMCLAMGVIGASIPLGVVVGVLGVGLTASTYPLHNKILSRRKNKYKNQILSKVEELQNSYNYENYKSSNKETVVEVEHLNSASKSNESILDRSN